MKNCIVDVRFLFFFGLGASAKMQVLSRQIGSQSRQRESSAKKN